MTEQDQREQPIARFEVTIALADEGRRKLADLDLDVLIPPPEIRERGEILAIATFEQIDRLVSAGAEVTIRAKVRDRFPQDQIASEEDVRAKVEQVARLAERGDD